jgi:hypothetical protein
MQIADVACAFLARTCYLLHERSLPDHFAVCAVGERIHRRAAFGALAFLGQEREVAGHRLKVAADVDYALGGHCGPRSR